MTTSQDNTAPAPDKQGISRRRVLFSAAILSLGAICFKSLTMLWSYLSPPARKNAFGGLVDAGTLDAIPQVSDAPLIYPQGKFWLVNSEEGLAAVHSACTHLECLFNWNSEAGEFICPCHGSRFSKEGKVLNGPATRDLERFPIQIVDAEGKIIRQTDEISGAALDISDLLAEQKKQHEDAQKTGDESEPVKNSIQLQVDTGKLIKISSSS